MNGYSSQMWFHCIALTPHPPCQGGKMAGLEQGARYQGNTNKGTACRAPTHHSPPFPRQPPSFITDFTPHHSPPPRLTPPSPRGVNRAGGHGHTPRSAPTYHLTPIKRRPWFHCIALTPHPPLSGGQDARALSGGAVSRENQQGIGMPCPYVSFTTPIKRQPSCRSTPISRHTIHRHHD